MLKHRQDGLVFLHGLFLDLAVSALFLLQVGVVRATGWIEFNVDVNWSVYFMGVVVAMVWNHRSLPSVAVRLGVLTFVEALRLTRQQLYRLMAVLFAVGFTTQDVSVSRSFIGVFIAVAGALMLFANWSLPRWLTGFLFRALQFRTVVLSSMTEAVRLRDWLCSRQYLGQSIVGCVPPASDPTLPEHGVPRLGGIGDLRAILADRCVNQIIINRGQFTREEQAQIRDEAERAACRVRYFADLESTLGPAMAVVECHDRYAFAAEAAEPLDNPVNSLVKRGVDLVVALPVVCLVLPPLTLVVWLMQRLQSPGPVFYRQERSGLHQQRFQIFKFRSMHAHPEQEAIQATRDDPRVFSFGRFLRKSSLDEFPQFINVLLGEMSVSGPRPHLLEHDRQFAAVVGSYYRRHYVKPGITGLAQSAGFRGEVAGHPELLQQRIDHDLRYVTMWSLGLDLRILAATARQLVRPPRAAY